MDSWTYYDPKNASEAVLREERDFDGDGIVDLWSHYKDGRLYRRDVSAVGMAYLSGKEKAAAESSSEPQSVPDSI